LATGAAAATGTGPGLAFFRRGRRTGFGMIAFIDRLIRFIVGSTPMTFTLTISPTFTA
jgi:hypothetical protein